MMYFEQEERIRQASDIIEKRLGQLQAIADAYQKYGWEDGFGEVKYLLDALVEGGNP